MLLKAHMRPVPRKRRGVSFFSRSGPVERDGARGERACHLPASHLSPPPSSVRLPLPYPRRLGQVLAGKEAGDLFLFYAVIMDCPSLVALSTRPVTMWPPTLTSATWMRASAASACHAPLPPANAVDVRSPESTRETRNGKRNLPLSPSSDSENAMSLNPIQRTLKTPPLAYGPHVILCLLHNC